MEFQQKVLLCLNHEHVVMTDACIYGLSVSLSSPPCAVSTVSEMCSFTPSRCKER